MTISASMVKTLRERTGAGMMECKKALTAADGDMDAAVEALRKKGAAKADQKAGRVAAEGVIASAFSVDRRQCALVEVNCETDFVAKDDGFLAFAQNIADTVVKRRPSDTEALARLELVAGGNTVEAARVELFAKIGENINIRRFVCIATSADEIVSEYLHGRRIGVLVKTRGGRADLGRDLAMHIAATKPMCISKDDVPEDTLAKEREIFAAQGLESGKPENIVEKIVEGRVQKYLNEITLLGQPFVKNPDTNVGKLLSSENAQVLQFARYEVGEGIEKRSDDFVAEVMAQAKGTN